MWTIRRAMGWGDHTRTAPRIFPPCLTRARLSTNFRPVLAFARIWIGQLFLPLHGGGPHSALQDLDGAWRQRKQDARARRTATGQRSALSRRCGPLRTNSATTTIWRGQLHKSRGDLFRRRNELEKAKSEYGASLDKYESGGFEDRAQKIRTALAGLEQTEGGQA